MHLLATVAHFGQGGPYRILVERGDACIALSQSILHGFRVIESLDDHRQRPIAQDPQLFTAGLLGSLLLVASDFFALESPRAPLDSFSISNARTLAFQNWKYSRKPLKCSTASVFSVKANMHARSPCMGTPYTMRTSSTCE